LPVSGPGGGCLSCSVTAAARPSNEVLAENAIALRRRAWGFRTICLGYGTAAPGTGHARCPVPAGAPPAQSTG